MERRADLVIVFDGPDGPELAVVVEHQLARDADKRRAWPLYAAALHARSKCPTLLVVVTPYEAVARWARRPVDTFQPPVGFVPYVVGPSDVPRIDDLEVARKSPELAVLSALVHGRKPRDQAVVRAALSTLPSLDDARARTYLDLLSATLGAPVRALLEHLMSLGKYEYKSDFAKKYVEEGRVEGRQEGRVEGRQEGRVEGRRQALLAVLEARGLGRSAEARERVERCDDLARLERWLVRAATADDDGAVFD